MKSFKVKRKGSIVKWFYGVIAAALIGCSGYHFLEYLYGFGFEVAAVGLVNARFYLIVGILFVILSRISATQAQIAEARGPSSPPRI